MNIISILKINIEMSIKNKIDILDAYIEYFEGDIPEFVQADDFEDISGPTNYFKGKVEETLAHFKNGQRALVSKT
jgi:hypothetical protein